MRHEESNNGTYEGDRRVSIYTQYKILNITICETRERGKQRDVEFSARGNFHFFFFIVISKKRGKRGGVCVKVTKWDDRKREKKTENSKREGKRGGERERE